MSKIPVAGPWITAREIEYVTDAVSNAWYADANRYHQRLETAFAEYVGRRFAIALPSCTSAIHLALAGLGVGEGDEVVVPDLTWIASSAPIDYVGATPVFADVETESWCLSAETLEKSLGERCAAVIAVDLYGNMPDMQPLLELAAKRGIPVIEDAAEAIGSTCGGKLAGSFGDASVFSFHGSKTLTSGEGGMLLTDDPELNDRVRFLMDHGRIPGDVSFQNEEIAFKYKMSSMQAALGLAQLERVDELVGRKKDIFGWYRERLSGVEGLRLNPDLPGRNSSYWMSTVLVEDRGLDKATLMNELAQIGVDSRPMFSPLSSLRAYSGLDAAATAARENTNAYALGEAGLNLPSALCLEEDDVERVCEALLSVLARYPLQQS